MTLVTTELGNVATFTVRLHGAPTAKVTIPLSSSNTAEGTLSVDRLIFTPDDWDTPQTVTITPVDDALVDGDVAYTIVIGPALSADDVYDAMDADDVSVVNHDDETPGFAVDPVLGLATSEWGDAASFTVRLFTEPTADVVLTLASSDPSEGILSTTTLTFTPDNWDQPQTVTITGVDDSLYDGNIAYTIITYPAVSDDDNYDGVDADDVSVINYENDFIGIDGAKFTVPDWNIRLGSTTLNEG